MDKAVTNRLWTLFDHTQAKNVRLNFKNVNILLLDLFKHLQESVSDKLISVHLWNFHKHKETKAIPVWGLVTNNLKNSVKKLRECNRYMRKFLCQCLRRTGARPETYVTLGRSFCGRRNNTTHNVSHT